MRIRPGVLVGLLLLLTVPTPLAQAGWFCTEGASERRGHIILACGVATARDEDRSRKAALENAFKELEMVCSRSADCRDFELNISPKRNDCGQRQNRYTCYRAIEATITSNKRDRSGDSLQPQLKALEAVLAAALAQKRAEQPTLPEPVGEPVVFPEFTGCSADTRRLGIALADLSSRAKVDVMAREAIKIPALECWPVHSRVLRYLGRFAIVSSRYDDFLLDALIDTTPGNHRRPEIITDITNYFHAVGTFRGHASFVFEALVSTGLGLPSMHQRILGITPPHPVSLEEQRWWLTQLAEAAVQGQIGLPVALSPDDALLRLFVIATPLPELVLTLAQRYFDPLSDEADYVRLFGIFAGVAGRADDAMLAGTLASYMGDSVARAPASIEMGEAIVRWYENRERELRRLDDEDDDDLAIIRRYETTEARFRELASGKLEASLGLVRHAQRQHSRVLFCARHRIDCDSIMPTLETVRADLASQSLRPRRDALGLLALLPEMAATLEDDIVQNLRTIDFDSGGPRRPSTLANEAVKALMVIPNPKPSSLEAVIVEIAWGRVHEERAIEGFGARLVRPAMTILANKDEYDGAHHRALRIIMLLGPAAREAKPLLEKELQSRDGRNPPYRSYLEAALRQME